MNLGRRSISRGTDRRANTDWYRRSLRAVAAMAIIGLAACGGTGHVITPAEQQVICKLGCIAAAQSNPSPKPADTNRCLLACESVTPEPTVTIPPTSTSVSTPTATATATATPSPTPAPTVNHPTDTPAPAGYKPPTVAFVNGCNAGDPNSVDPRTGKCEFNIWEKIMIPDPANFTPPCDPSQCPSVWRPAGMGIACDHMYADQGVPAAVYEPKIGKWVTIMYYVCSGRLADSVIDFDIHAVYPSHDCKNGETGNCVSWKARTFRPDPYNGTIAGIGDYVVCLSNNAYTCKDAADLNDPKTYDTGVCKSGNVPLPGAGTCIGPYHVNR